MYRLEGSTIRLQSRTRRQSNRQIHLGLECNVISSFAQWRLNPQFTRLPINWHIHEAIERDRDLVRSDTVRLQRSGQVSKAAAVGLLVAVDDAEGLLATRCEKEVVSAHCVLDDTEHHVAAIGVEWITCSQVDAAGIVERSSGRDDFSMILGVEG